MTPEQTRLAIEFGLGLGKLKAQHELGQGAELTANEVAGMIWAINNLRGGRDRRDAAPLA